MNSELTKYSADPDVQIPVIEQEIKRGHSQSHWSMLWKRFSKNGAAISGLLFLSVIIILAVFAPVIAPYPLDQINFEERLLKPSATHLFGTDDFGRDIFTRILYGGRVSLMMGLISVTICVVLGVTLGVVAGYYRKLDMYIMQLMDILMSFPSLLLAIVVIAVLGVGLTNAMIAVAISQIPQFVRVVRSAVLTLREKEYIEAVRALGIRDYQILLKHVIPNILSPMIVMTALIFGDCILAASALSFLGLGAQPPDPEWGAMVMESRVFLNQAWWMSLFPGLVILLVVLSFNMLGDGLRDALDPKQK
ncbi:ABC transporter permease [uncultured Brevibacillus sp.]|uniref:ABC transporter permease n=1 Tax=uncultured Brevibacillus sp. TaxID=169970 RepID=UPI0025916358|nr:ABC transporter permease [uncultured Brevibacillus sp.]